MICVVLPPMRKYDYAWRLSAPLSSITSSVSCRVSRPMWCRLPRWPSATYLTDGGRSSGCGLSPHWSSCACRPCISHSSRRPSIGSRRYRTVLWRQKPKSSPNRSDSICPRCTSTKVKTFETNSSNRIFTNSRFLQAAAPAKGRCKDCDCTRPRIYAVPAPWTQI